MKKATATRWRKWGKTVVVRGARQEVEQRPAERQIAYFAYKRVRRMLERGAGLSADPSSSFGAIHFQHWATMLTTKAPREELKYVVLAPLDFTSSKSWLIPLRNRPSA